MVVSSLIGISSEILACVGELSPIDVLLSPIHVLGILQLNCLSLYLSLFLSLSLSLFSLSLSLSLVLSLSLSLSFSFFLSVSLSLYLLPYHLASLHCQKQLDMRY